MKKRNLIIAALLTTAIGAGVVYAGANSCKSGHGHKYGRHMDHKIDHVVGKIDRHLDLTEVQETRIREILDSNIDLVHIGRDTRQALQEHLLGLDPLSEDYQESADELADMLARQVREKTLASARIVREIAETLDTDQIEMARQHLDRRIKRFERWHNSDHDEEN